jgi:predicted nucleic acid-binding protein
MSFVVLDAGALIAIERGSRRVQALLERISNHGVTILVPAGVVAEGWRNGARQARVAKLLAAAETQIVPLDGVRARAAGVLLGNSGGENVIDASVVLCARERGTHVAVLTSDPLDLSKLDADLSIVAI